MTSPEMKESVFEKRVIAKKGPTHDSNVGFKGKAWRVKGENKPGIFKPGLAFGLKLSPAKPSTLKGPGAGREEV